MPGHSRATHGGGRTGRRGLAGDSRMVRGPTQVPPQGPRDGIQGGQGEPTQSGPSTRTRHWYREGGLIGGRWTLSLSLSVDQVQVPEQEALPMSKQAEIPFSKLSYIQENRQEWSLETRAPAAAISPIQGQGTLMSHRGQN